MKKIFILLLIGIITAIVLISTLCYFFPLKYKDEIIELSKKYEIDQTLIMSVIWAESGFDVNAVSKKGAVGLMQLMPETADYVKQYILKIPSEVNLNSPEENIEIGIAYLKHLLNKFPIKNTALAAYNAGEGTVGLWLLNSEYSQDGLNLKNIPYKETRDYVNKVNFAYNVYKFLR